MNWGFGQWLLAVIIGGWGLLVISEVWKAVNGVRERFGR